MTRRDRADHELDPVEVRVNRVEQLVGWFLVELARTITGEATDLERHLGVEHAERIRTAIAPVLRGGDHFRVDLGSAAMIDVEGHLDDADASLRVRVRLDEMTERTVPGHGPLPILPRAMIMLLEVDPAVTHIEDVEFHWVSESQHSPLTDAAQALPMRQ